MGSPHVLGGIAAFLDIVLHQWEAVVVCFAQPRSDPVLQRGATQFNSTGKHSCLNVFEHVPFD